MKLFEDSDEIKSEIRKVAAITAGAIGAVLICVTPIVALSPLFGMALWYFPIGLVGTVIAAVLVRFAFREFE